MNLILLGAFFLYGLMTEEIKQAEEILQIPPKKVVFYFDGFNFYHGFQSLREEWNGISPIVEMKQTGRCRAP